MGQPATPRYMPVKSAGFYEDLSPGLAFYTFFPIWQSQEKEWALEGHGKSEALKKVIGYSKAAREQTEALINRQKTLINTLDASHRHSITATSTSPFMTGTGMEHPLENGFAFLNPYGLPCLPGSSIKGVLRNTARLLAEDAFGEGSQGWTPMAVEVLFGSEVPTGREESADFRRGALLFWDVIVSPKEEIKGGQKSQSMKVDILTPHQSHYLQNGATPHDSGDPNPVPFLCVGPGAEFNFHIQASPGLLGEYADIWKDLMQVCFEHAFDWLGFGAKTAVGYGVLKQDEKQALQAKAAREAAQAKAAFEAKNAGKSENQKAIEAFKDNLPPENLWKGKGPGQGPDFNGIAAKAETWTDIEDIKAALAMFEEKLPVWLGKPVKENKIWKSRINELKRNAGLL